MNLTFLLKIKSPPLNAKEPFCCQHCPAILGCRHAQRYDRELHSVRQVMVDQCIYGEWLLLIFAFCA